MNFRSGTLLIFALLLTACDSRVYDPWVQNDDYAQAERQRSPELNRELDHRVSNLRDR